MHLGIGGILLLVVLSFIFKVNLFDLGSSNPQTATRPVTGGADRTQPEEREVQFVSFVLDDVQKTWDRLLPQMANVPYRHAKLVLFRDYTESGCGTAESATGPFYCPVDEKVYIDLGFYQELSDRFGAPGEFAQAYVLAHEIGHHVQKLIGVEQRVRRLQRSDPSAVNPLSVKLELQADCLAGVWGHSTAQRSMIDEADISAGLAATGAVGDDRLQRMATGHVSPENFTHGSSAERTQAFRRGLDSGTMSACDTIQ